jgi:hypothetical protein
MIAVNGYYENGICIPTESLDVEGRKKVIITIMEDEIPVPNNQNKQIAIQLLRNLCHPGKHIWTESPDEYIRGLRDNDRI